MLVPDLGSLKVLLVLGVVDFLENILELSIVRLENRVLGAHVERELLVQRHLERGMRETGNGFGGVVLRLRDTALCREVEDLDHLRLTALWCEDHFQCTLARDNPVLGAVLVAESVTANDDGLLPARYETRDGGNDDRGAENSSSSGVWSATFLHISLRMCALQVVADGTVGRQPHLLELEFLDALLIGGDGGALDTNRVLLDSLGGIECDLVVGLVAVWQAKIVVLEVNVEVWVDELQCSAHVCMSLLLCRAHLVLDDLPDDSGHLIAVKLHDRVLDLYFLGS